MVLPRGTSRRLQRLSGSCHKHQKPTWGGGGRGYLGRGLPGYLGRWGGGYLGTWGDKRGVGEVSNIVVYCWKIGDLCIIMAHVCVLVLSLRLEHPFYSLWFDIRLRENKP